MQFNNRECVGAVDNGSFSISCADLIQNVDKLLFADFVRAAACRAGQMLNVHDIAGDVGVSDDTAKRWLQVQEKSDVIFYLHPYSNNLLKRTVRTPKPYFLIPA